MFLGKRPCKNCFILELTAPIVMDILRRLPLRTLLQCRFVCKKWRDLVSDPHFDKLHFSGVPTCITYGTRDDFYVLGLKQNEAYVSSNNTGADMSVLTRFFSKTPVIIENSCNGLVCFRQIPNHECIYIANPLTGEYMSLPSYKGNPNPGMMVTCLMGYCPNNNLYKVVRIKFFNGKAEICTVGFGSWRKINGYLPCGIDGVIDGVYLNGALHWVCSRHNYKSIVTIELENERIMMLPLPHDFSLNGSVWRLKLGKLRDCLSIWRSKESDADIEIWVMKEYGVKESWSKELVIKNPNPIYGWLTFELITTLENGDILISLCCRFYIYNPTKKSFKTLLHRGNYGKIVPHLPSFISLRDVSRNSSKVLDDVQEREMKTRIN